MSAKKGIKTFREDGSVFVVAEISANHGQDFDRAMRIQLP